MFLMLMYVLCIEETESQYNVSWNLKIKYKTTIFKLTCHTARICDIQKFSIYVLFSPQYILSTYIGNSHSSYLHIDAYSM